MTEPFDGATSGPPPHDPFKPPTVVEVKSFQKGERNFYYSFKAKGKSMQVYGLTRKESEDRLHEVLRYEYGPLNYSIAVTE